MQYTENRVFDGLNIGYANDALSPSDALVADSQNPRVPRLLRPFGLAYTGARGEI